MEKVEWQDVQGLVLSGYPRLPYSAFVLWHFRPQQRPAAKQWLALLSDRVMRAGADLEGDDDFRTARVTSRPHIQALKHAPPEELYAINVALTSRGLRQLAVATEAMETFSLEFLEGMAPKPKTATDTPRRTNVLGDLGESSPRLWDWGGWGPNDDVDGVLLLFAADEASLTLLLEDELAAMAEAAEALHIGSKGPAVLKGRIYEDRKEHFGFTDGISQPIIEGSHTAQKGEHSEQYKRTHFVKPGEFVLGYKNERDAYAIGSNIAGDLRRNGSYLVFRQLEQDAAAFQDFLEKTASTLGIEGDKEAKKNWVAGKLVGRARDGTPLIPTEAGVLETSVRNDFLYYFQDRSGLECPVGAHIRRANPRDSKGPDPDTALRLSKMHRIIRRGRMYGERFDPKGSPGHDDQGERGILFMCLNADIAGQFELIQHSWLNNRHFGDRYVGSDPFGHYSDNGGTMTISHRPINLVLERPRPFVRVRGGAYFFLPGIAALKSLAA